MATKTVKAGTTAIAKWDEQLAGLAAKATEVEKGVGGGNFVKTAGATFNFRGADVGNELDVVIVEHILENALYEGRYDPDNPQPPVCFAFGTNEDEMAPHEDSSKPQAERCKGCPNNEFGSADVGRGKACKNTRRMAMITEGDLANVEEAEVAYLKIPVTSVKAWAGYVRNLSDTLHRPPLGVVTNITLVKDPKTQFKAQFKCKEQVADEYVGDLIELNKKQQTAIRFPYSAPEEKAAAPVPTKAMGGKFAKNRR